MEYGGHTSKIGLCKLFCFRQVKIRDFAKKNNFGVTPEINISYLYATILLGNTLDKFFFTYYVEISCFDWKQ